MPYLFTASLPTFLCASKLNPPLIDILRSTETNTALLLYVFSIRKQDESAHLDGSFFLSPRMSAPLFSNPLHSRLGISMLLHPLSDAHRICDAPNLTLQGESTVVDETAAAVVKFAVVLNF